MLGSFAVCIVFLEAMKVLARQRFVSSVTCRKLIHIGTGPIFLLTWRFYSFTDEARYWAAVVPAVITLQFALIGLGVLQDRSVVNTMSRTGKPSELLLGPTFYGIIFVVSTIHYWRHRTTGLIAVMLLCVGDGMADVIGRNFGRPCPLPFNKTKSFVGSLAFFVFSFMACYFFLDLFYEWHWLAVNGASYAAKLVRVTAVAMLVEMLPLPEIDNITVFVAGVLGDMYL